MSSDTTRKTLTPAETAGFCSQIAMVLGAGISVYEGTSALLDNESKKENREILSIIFSELENGSTFHHALGATKVFPKYVLNMIGIGERTGKLEEVLYSLADYCEREDNIRSEIMHAVTYPLIMIIMMLAIITVLVTKVLPLFNQIYEELGTGLTGFSLVLLNISNTFNRYFPVIIAIVLIIIIFIVILFRSSFGKSLRSKSDLSLQIASSRFANCMALALNSGLDSDQGLALSLTLVDNPYIESVIRKCQINISSGMGFEYALIESGIFSGIYKSMILIAAKTGSMDKTMKKIADDYNTLADEKISRKIAMLEPTLVIILSIVIGLLLLSFLLPLLGIMNSIG